MIITVAGAMRVWPFPTLTAAPWIFQLSTQSFLLRWLFVGIFFAGVGGLSWAWVLLVRCARAGNLSVRKALSIFLVWAVAVFFAAPICSGDVYVYVVQGQGLVRGFNPYESGVSAMGASPQVLSVHPLWRETQTMYGPLYLRVAEAVGRLTDDNVIAGVFAFRALAVVSLLAVFGEVVAIAKRLQRSQSVALVIAVLNPLVILHLIGGAHNDATMLALLLGGIAVGLHAKRIPLRLLAVTLCAAGAAFKMPALAGALVLGWIWAGSGATVLRRLIYSAIAGVVSLAAFEAVTLASGYGWGWIDAFDVPGLAHPNLAPANALALSFGGIFNVAFAVNTVTRAVALVISVALAVYFVVRNKRNGSETDVIRSAGWALFTLGWLGPAVYPWYLTWGIVLLGIVGVGRLTRPLIFLTIALNFFVSPGGYGWFDPGPNWQRTVAAFLMLTLMAVFAKWSFDLGSGRNTLFRTAPDRL